MKKAKKKVEIKLDNDAFAETVYDFNHFDAWVELDASNRGEWISGLGDNYLELLTGKYGVEVDDDEAEKHVKLAVKTFKALGVLDVVKARHKKAIELDDQGIDSLEFNWGEFRPSLKYSYKTPSVFTRT